MHLNTSNGKIYFEELGINESISINAIKKLKDKYDIVAGVTNADYASFSIRNIDNRESSLALQFFKNKLQSVFITAGSLYNFPPFEISAAEKVLTEKRLELIGGEKTYDWGEVSFIEDSKGGNVGISIKYKSTD